MKNYKKVLALVLSFVLALSSMSFAFAADVQNTTKADTLNDLGLFRGTDDGYELDTTFTRAQGATMILRLLGKEEAAKAANLEPAFTDVKGTWAAPFVAFAAKAELVKGTSETKYVPGGEMSGRQWLTLVLRALGQDPTEAWDNTATLAIEKKLVANAAAVDKSPFLRDDMIAVAYTALSVEVKGTSKTLLETLVDSGAVSKSAAEASKLYNVAPVVATATKVEKVFADNLKEVVVVFDGAVDKATAEKKENYSFKDDAAKVDGVSVSDDLKTVTLTVEGSMKNQDEYKLTVKDVKAGTATIKAEDLAFVPVDVTLPTVVRVTSLGTKAFKVTFSEPVTNVEKGQFELDGKSYTINSVKVDGKTVTVRPYSTLTVGAHEVTVKNVEDFAGLKTGTTKVNFDVAEDKEAPVIISVKTAYLEKIEIVMSEDIDPDTLDKDKIYWLKGTDKVKADSVSVDGATITANFAGDDTLPTYEVEVVVEGVKDYSGNEAKDQKVKVKAQADETRPTVSEVKWGSTKDKIVVKFDKAVNEEDATKTSNYVIKNKDNDPVAIKQIVLDGKEATITLFSAVDNNKITIEIANVKDVTKLKNVMLPKTFTLEVGDINNEGINGYTYTVGTVTETGKFIIFFKEEMKEAELEKASNYLMVYDGQTKALDSNIKINAEFKGKSVILTIPKTTTNWDNTKLEGITLLTYEDKAGNKNYSYTVAIGSTVELPLTLEKAELTGRKVIETEFNQDILAADKDKITVVNGGAVTKVEVDGKKVKITMNGDVAKSAEGTLTVNFAVDAVTLLGGAKNAGARTKAVTDKVAPEKDGGMATNASGQIAISYNENVSSVALSVLRNSFTLYAADNTKDAISKQKYAVTAIVGNKVVITFNNLADWNTNGYYVTSVETELLVDANTSDLKAKAFDKFLVKQ